MPLPDHISWPVFPILAARLKQIEVKLAQGPALPVLYSQEESRQILAGLESSIAATNVASCTSAPILDHFLEKIQDGFLSNYVLPGASPQSLALIGSVSRLYGSKPCVDCGAVAKCTSSAVITNAQAVHKFGECISVLRRLFEFVVRFCDESYGAYAQHAPRPQLALYTGALGEADDILDLAITGETREMQGGGRSINIHFTVPDVDLDEYFACLYIMFHECFIHGWCGLRLDSATASYSDEFHEGWLDWVGYELLNERLAAGAGGPSDPWVTHACEFQTAGVKARDRRLNFSRKHHHLNAASYASAEMAARLLFRFFHVAIEDRQRARAAFFRFSLSLNASAIGDERRADLVVDVLRHLGGREDNLTLINYVALCRAIKDFSSGGSVLDLVSVLNSR